MQPRHCAPDIVAEWRENVGPERSRYAWPLRSLSEQGAVLAFSSDWTVAETAANLLADAGWDVEILLGQPEIAPDGGQGDDDDGDAEHVDKLHHAQQGQRCPAAAAATARPASRRGQPGRLR